jgi:hypothetical protein
LEALDEPLDQLVARPLMSVQTTKRAVANPKTEYDAREVISVINPALDMMRAGQFHTQLAQLCFGDLKLTETGPDGSTENLTGEVVAEEARMQSDKPDNRSPWAQQLGETAESFAALVVYRDLGPARNLAEAQRLMAKLQKGRKRATGKRDVSGCMKRWSRRWKWPDRALAWDAMLEGERTAAVVAAIHKEGQKWAARWEEFREKAWLRSEALGETLDQLVARPLMSVQTTKRAVANPKTEYDAREVISLINPALDMMRAGHFHTQLVQLCFGDLKTNRDWTRWFDGKFDGEVVAGEARIVNRPRGTATEDL